MLATNLKTFSKPAFCKPQNKSWARSVSRHVKSRRCCLPQRRALDGGLRPGFLRQSLYLLFMLCAGPFDDPTGCICVSSTVCVEGIGVVWCFFLYTKVRKNKNKHILGCS